MYVESYVTGLGTKCKGSRKSVWTRFYVKQTEIIAAGYHSYTFQPKGNRGCVCVGVYILMVWNTGNKHLVKFVSENTKCNLVNNFSHP